MRLFVAIDLPKDIKDHLYNLQKQIGNKYAKIKWVDKKSLHLTLKFLGDFNERDLKDLKQALSEIKIKTFKLKLEKFGVFSNLGYNGPISVMWAGIEKSKDLFELQKEVDYRTINIYNSPVDFNAHLTFGRVKIIKDKKKFMDSLNNIKIQKLDFEVASFVLFKSTLSKDGPNYEVLEKYQLS